MQKVFNFIIIAVTATLLIGCKGTKLIAKKDRLYAYVDNQQARLGNPAINDSLICYKVIKTFKSNITPNVRDDFEYYFITKTKKELDSLVGIRKLESVGAATKTDPANLGFGGKIYFPELSNTDDRKPFRYYDVTFGIQALTVPIKIRKHLANDSLFPKQVETGFNIGFAPGFKFNYYIFDPTHKFLGKRLTTYSATPGLLLGLGTAGLKQANAPGLPTIDRTALVFTYGGYFVLGINNINVGFAAGWDRVTDSGRKYWVYQNKMWYGIIVSLDVIKF
jgi:hypothetical protein